MCVWCRGLDLNKLLHIFFSNAAYTSASAADIYQELCEYTHSECAGHHAVSRHGSL